MNPVSLAALRPADDGKLVREIVTPEGIPLRFTLARAGDRAGAFVLDTLAQIIVIIAVSWGLSLATGGASSWLTAVIVVLAFLLANFYFAFFEVRWQGATWGKRRVGLRVIDARGGQLETSAVLARNLVRELEVWMPLRLLFAQQVVWPGAPGWARVIAVGWTLVFLLLPLFNKDRLRVGDLIAGTMVVVQPKVVLMPDLVAEAAPLPVAAQVMTPAHVAAATYPFTEAQLAVYGIYELQVLEDVLRREPGSQAYQIALRTVTEKIHAKTRYDRFVPAGDEERFLRDFYAALRAHLEQKLLFGKRREDKHSR